MSSYDNNLYDAGLSSIARRLRIKDYQRPESIPLRRPVRPYDKEEQKLEPSLEGLINQQMRLDAVGGFSEQERMIFDKRRNFDKALLYSYQGANIINIREKTDTLLSPKPVRALINPNKLKADYDEKIISVAYEANFKPGDVFEWLGTNTYWLIYLQNLTELAYFRADIRKCSYQILWKDDNGDIKSTYAAIRGPVETKINYIQKHLISVDEPNYSLNILMPQTPDTLAYFKRYSKFYLKDSNVCWRVEAVDWISLPDILEVTAVEYYSNEMEDSDSIAGNLIVEEVNPNTPIENAAISGPTFIKPKVSYEYVTAVKDKWQWYVDPKYPIKLSVSADNPKKCTIKWEKGISGQFELSYGDYNKTIIVESLF